MQRSDGKLVEVRTTEYGWTPKILIRLAIDFSGTLVKISMRRSTGIGSEYSLTELGGYVMLHVWRRLIIDSLRTAAPDVQLH